MADPSASDAIVVIDDDPAMRMACRKILEKSSFKVETFEDGAQALEGIARRRPGLVVVDLKMPGMSGMEVIARVHQMDPDVVLVVITGYATIDTAVEAMKSGAYDFLPKPFSPEELRLIVNRGLERRRLVLEGRRMEVERALLKRRFVTFVSHQLQTPLVAVHQYLDVLKQLGSNPEVAAKRDEWVERCLLRIEAMQVMVKEWLELSRAESETISRRREKVDVNAVLSAILETYSQQAFSGQICLEAALAEGGCFVAGDQHSISVLFDNLIVNAIKYNQPGGKVRVGTAQCGAEVAISVADTGIGIPEKYIPFLFDEFFRVKDEAKKTTGAGLGLAICRKIVSELDGTIEVESKVMAGSTFRVRLPAWREQGIGEDEDHSDRR